MELDAKYVIFIFTFILKPFIIPDATVAVRDFDATMESSVSLTPLALSFCFYLSQPINAYHD